MTYLFYAEKNSKGRFLKHVPEDQSLIDAQEKISHVLGENWELVKIHNDNSIALFYEAQENYSPTINE